MPFFTALVQGLNRYWPVLSLLAGMATVGSYVALSKPLVAAIPVFVLAMLRFSIAAILMLPWLKHDAHDRPLNKRAQAYLFVQSLFGNFLFSICMLYGVMLSNAVTAGIVMAAIPAAVALLSRLILGETLTRRMAVAIALSVLAVLLLQFAKAGTGVPLQHRWGIALLLCAVVCEAVYVVLAKRLSGTLSAKRGSALLNAWGLVLMLPLAAWQAWDTTFNLTQLNASTWGLLLYYAVAASVLSTWLWFTGLRHVAANQAGVYTVALPMTATLLGVWVFDEWFTAWHAAAFGLAIASVLCASWPTQARTHAA